MAVITCATHLPAKENYMAVMAIAYILPLNYIKITASTNRNKVGP